VSLSRTLLRTFQIMWWASIFGHWRWGPFWCYKGFKHRIVSWEEQVVEKC